MSLRTLLLVGAAATALAGCGKLGDLEKPGPLNGSGTATTRKADEKQRQAQDPARPVDTVDSRDVSTDPAPPRAAPIPGAPNDPFGTAPRGALPNDYSNPR